MEKQLSMAEIIIQLGLTPDEIEQFGDFLDGNFKTHDIPYYQGLMSKVYPVKPELATTILWNDSKGFAVRRCSYYRSYVTQAEFEALVSSAKLGVLEAIRTYDGNSKPTTYFNGFIMDHIHKTLNRDMSKAANRIHRKIETARQDLGNEGIFGPSIDILSRKTGLSAEVIRANEEEYRAKKSQVSLFAEDSPTEIIPAFDRADETLNPEAMALRNERNLLVMSEIKKLLTDIEQKILFALNLDEMSIRNTAKTLGITDSKVTTAYRSALSKLHASTKLREYVGVFEDDDEDELRFIDDEDVFADILD